MQWRQAKVMFVWSHCHSDQPFFIQFWSCLNIPWKQWTDNNKAQDSCLALKADYNIHIHAEYRIAQTAKKDKIKLCKTGLSSPSPPPLPFIYYKIIMTVHDWIQDRSNIKLLGGAWISAQYWASLASPRPIHLFY